MLLTAIFTFGSLVCSWTAQLLIWRIKKPKSEFLAMGAIFMSTLLLALLVLASAQPRIFSTLYFLMCYSVLTLSYISFYSLVAGQSPSVHIVMKANAERTNGLSIENATIDLAQTDFVGVRLFELQDQGLIVLDNQTYKLTNKGLIWAKILFLGRKVFGLPKGG